MGMRMLIVGRRAPPPSLPCLLAPTVPPPSFLLLPGRADLPRPHPLEGLVRHAARRGAFQRLAAVGPRGNPGVRRRPPRRVLCPCRCLLRRLCSCPRRGGRRHHRRLLFARGQYQQRPCLPSVACEGHAPPRLLVHQLARLARLWGKGWASSKGGRWRWSRSSLDEELR